MKVYILGKSSHDFTDAERFGDLTFITEGVLPRYQTNLMTRIFEEKLTASSPDDFILITGLTVGVSILCALFATKHKRLNLLIYKASERRYIDRTIVIGE